MLMLPGYNEPSEHLQTLANGRHGLPGLRAHGFECVMLPPCYERLRDRIDRLAEYIADLRRKEYPFPIVLVGYSLGGLVARGYLRAYPHLAHEIDATIMIGTPNFGVTTYVIPHIVRLLRIPDQALDDLSYKSDYLAWLNGTSGHWEVDSRTRRRVWVLGREPWLGPAESRAYVIAGLLSARADGDGIVRADSASLGSRFPTHYVIGPNCNHMNIIGNFDPVVFLWTGFLVNDLVWPQTLRAILRFSGALQVATAKQPVA
jgi:pimeloyl-ACP methyl ester carboxylesterase